MQNSLFDEPPVVENKIKSDARGGQAPALVKAVLVPYAVDKAYSYAVPEDMAVQDGDYVTVPLGNREIPGVIWGEAVDKVAPQKLKSIIAHHDVPPMPTLHRRFIDWVSHYTMSAPGAVLKMAVSVPAALESPKPASGYLPGQEVAGEPKGLTPQRRKVLEVLQDYVPRRAAEIAEMAGCSPGVIKAMADKGLLQEVELRSLAPCRKPDPGRKGPDLSPAQKEAAERLARAVEEKQFYPALLDGVTGAGKTETYFEAVAAALKQDKQVLILLPEIALSNAFLERFQKRFGCAPALWHSHLGPARRRTTWRGVAQGETKVVVGARSALFLPYPDLGLIVVDEEHEPAFKQEDGVIYNARDMSIVRAYLGRFPVVLVSATPSLETVHNAWEPPLGIGRYRHITLPDRYGGARMPEVEVIDLRSDRPESGHFIAPGLKTAVLDTIRRGEQALLFLNRRGYAPLTLCRSCGHRIECPRCTAWLVEHKSRAVLQCHHCGYQRRTPETCPECDDKVSLTACGPGVERIYEEAKAYFPDAKIALLASDTTESDARLRAMLDEIRDGAVDIIIGTQIIAKGHHFPGLTCVGVIDADLGLQGGELRAAERTYQLLHQVAGRAGRAEKPGHVYLQTFMPGHPIMQALSGGQRDAFLEAEIRAREASHMPPYSRLAGIIVSGREEGQVLAVAKDFGRTAPQGPQAGGHKIVTLGPAPAPMARLRGRYRYRLLVRADKELNIQQAIEAWVKRVKVPSNVRVQIDIDPQSFF